MTSRRNRGAIIGGLIGATLVAAYVMSVAVAQGAPAHVLIIIIAVFCVTAIPGIWVGLQLGKRISGDALESDEERDVVKPVSAGNATDGPPN
jgi:hypothetical protein